MEVEALFNFDNIECEMLDCVGMHIGIGSFAATTHTCIHTVMYIHMHTCVCTTGVDPNTCHSSRKDACRTLLSEVSILMSFPAGLPYLHSDLVHKSCQQLTCG